MAKPKPVPPKERVTEPSAWVKGLNKASVRSGSNPMPVSMMLMRNSRFLASTAGNSSVLTVTEPCSVNLMALPIKLVNTWRMRTGSSQSNSGKSLAVSKRKSMPLALASCASERAVCRTNCAGLTSSNSNSRALASILEKSKISLMI